MNDNLRTPIAAVLAEHMGAFSEKCGCTPSEVADAVIREVLTPEFLADLVIAAVQKAADDE